MKKTFFLAALVVLTLATAQAQPQHRAGGFSAGPHFDAAMAKLFGANQTFSAQLEFVTGSAATTGAGDTMTVPCKISFDAGKSRFEMNLSDIKSAKMSPQVAAQMKAMGMDALVAISRPDKKAAYVVYPGLQSYMELPLTAADDIGSADDFKADVTELGQETVGGHDCTKKKVVVTGKDGTKQEFTAWDAKDLKDFPVKIESTDQGHTTELTFTNIIFAKPAAGDYETPAGFTKYASQQAMMQAVLARSMPPAPAAGH